MPKIIFSIIVRISNGLIAEENVAISTAEEYIEYTIPITEPIICSIIDITI